MPRFVPSGTRRQAYKNFQTTHLQGGDNYALLLVDSESPVTDDSPWVHLQNRPEDSWEKPHNARDEQCHLMVQCMETWLLADRESLSLFFAQGFNENALPASANLEDIAKEDLLNGLRNATRACKRKASYGKGEHSFKLLALIDPKKVSEASPWAKRFIDALKELAAR